MQVVHETTGVIGNVSEMLQDGQMVIEWDDGLKGKCFPDEIEALCPNCGVRRSICRCDRNYSNYLEVQ